MEKDELFSFGHFVTNLKMLILNIIVDLEMTSSLTIFENFSDSLNLLKILSIPKLIVLYTQDKYFAFDI